MRRYSSSWLRLAGQVASKLAIGFPQIGQGVFLTNFVFHLSDVVDKNLHCASCSCRCCCSCIVVAVSVVAIIVVVDVVGVVE